MKLALRLFQDELLNENTYYALENSGRDRARKIVLSKKMKVN